MKQLTWSQMQGFLISALLTFWIEYIFLSGPGVRSTLCIVKCLAQALWSEHGHLCWRKHIRDQLEHRCRVPCYVNPVSYPLDAISIPSPSCESLKCLRTLPNVQCKGGREDENCRARVCLVRGCSSNSAGWNKRVSGMSQSRRGNEWHWQYFNLYFYNVERNWQICTLPPPPFAG